jgi:hypothetical protein
MEFEQEYYAKFELVKLHRVRQALGLPHATSIATRCDELLYRFSTLRLFWASSP